MTKAVDFLPNFSFVHCLTVSLAHSNCFYKFSKRFGDVSEPKFRKTMKYHGILDSVTFRGLFTCDVNVFCSNGAEIEICHTYDRISVP